jgi:hypothetical protein
MPTFAEKNAHPQSLPLLYSAPCMRGGSWSFSRAVRFTGTSDGRWRHRPRKYRWNSASYQSSFLGNSEFCCKFGTNFKAIFGKMLAAEERAIRSLPFSQRPLDLLLPLPSKRGILRELVETYTGTCSIRTTTSNAAISFHSCCSASLRSPRLLYSGRARILQ